MTVRFLAALLVAVLGLTLAACGNKGALVKPKPATPTAQPATVPKTLPSPGNQATNPPGADAPTPVDPQQH